MITWQMEGSFPPRVQFEGVPVVWLRLVPLSKVGFVQKLLASKSALAELVTINAAAANSSGTRKFIVFILLVVWFVGWLAMSVFPTSVTNGHPKGCFVNSFENKARRNYQAGCGAQMFTPVIRY